MADRPPTHHPAATARPALHSAASGSSLADGGSSGETSHLTPSSGNGGHLYGSHADNLSDVDLAPPPPIHDGTVGHGHGTGPRNPNGSTTGFSRYASRPGSRTSMLSAAETFRTATPTFDRRPSITPQLVGRSGAESPLLFDDQPQRSSSRLGAASPSLAVNYLPGKFSTRVFQPDRSQSPAHGGLFASRSASRLRAPPTLSYGLPNSGSSMSFNIEEDDEEARQSQQQHNRQLRLQAVTPFSSAVQRAAAQNPAQAPRLRHSIKRGAGRSAWGPDGGGSAVVGAGDYEDDDGVDLSRSASTRKRLRQQQRQAADGIDETGFQPGEADRRRTSMLHSDLGHFSAIPDSDDEHGGREQAVGLAKAGFGMERQRSLKQRHLRADESSSKAPKTSSTTTSFFGSLFRGRLAYILGFHDGHDAYDEQQEHEDEQFANILGAPPRDVVGASRQGPRQRKKRRAKWNPFKWAMVVANLVLTVYSIAAIIGTLFTWANVWENAATVRVGNRDELILSTVAAGMCLVSAVIGWCGILLNNRAFLSIYTVFLWIAFVFIMAPGYMTFKRRAFNLEGKLNQQWSRRLGVADRLVIQDELSCCGYFSPYVLASASGRCYSRSMLPGCKGRYMRFQRQALEYFYISAFSVVGPHLVIITVALLCSNNITYRFGKGLTPEEYRLDEVTAELIKEQLLNKSPGVTTPAGGSDSELRIPEKPFRAGSYGSHSEKGRLFGDEAGSSITAHAGMDDGTERRRLSAYAQGMLARGTFEKNGQEAHEMKRFSTGAEDQNEAKTPPRGPAADVGPQEPALGNATSQELQSLPVLNSVGPHAAAATTAIDAGHVAAANRAERHVSRDGAELGHQGASDDGAFYAI